MIYIIAWLVFTGLSMLAVRMNGPINWLDSLIISVCNGATFAFLFYLLEMASGGFNFSALFMAWFD